MATENAIEGIFSGNDVELRVTVTDKDSGLILDLTGIANLIFAIGSAPKASPKITKTLGGGITVTDAVAGKFSVALTAAELEPLKGILYHETRLTDAAGKKTTLMYGSFEIKENLIRN